MKGTGGIQSHDVLFKRRVSTTELQQLPSSNQADWNFDLGKNQIFGPGGTKWKEILLDANFFFCRR